MEVLTARVESYMEPEKKVVSDEDLQIALNKIDEMYEWLPAALAEGFLQDCEDSNVVETFEELLSVTETALPAETTQAKIR